ncbi:MAG: insulinase family protein [Calditrichaeota bacterium]|nr:MAG: insulinase family protein [Calditrichota bacterium]
MQSQYHKTVLDNGLTIVSEQIPAVRSVSIGVWVKTGTRFECPRQMGVAHFLEHMMFKGTERRTPRQIARSLESVGGHLNAFTSKELTCYFAEVLDEDLQRAVDVLSDILCHSTFPPKELEKERLVILDEIQGLEDSPEELVQDFFVEKLFGNHSLSYPILGRIETVSRISREDLVNFYSQHYLAPRVVVAAAGNVDHEHLVALCRRYFAFPEHNQPISLEPPQQFARGEYLIKRAINQVHVCAGVPAVAYGDPYQFHLLVLNTVLGGGMSSRLFQNIRERYGVAYAIYSFLDFYFDTGLLSVYLGTDRKNLARALKLLDREFERLRKHPISTRELIEAKAQIKGNLMLGLESTARRMTRLAKMEVYLNRFEDIDQTVERINRVSQEELWHFTRRLLEEDRILRVILLPQSDHAN